MGDEASTPEEGGAHPDGEQAAGVLPRAVVLEEALRAATALSAVVFGVSVLTALPWVADWVFAAALVGVAGSAPATASVRVRSMRSPELDVQSLWHATLLGCATLGLVVALLTVVARVADLATALTRLGAVLAVMAVMACLRGWDPRPGRPVAAPAPTDE